MAKYSKDLWNRDKDGSRREQRSFLRYALVATALFLVFMLVKKDGIITWDFNQPLTDGRWPVVHFNIYGSNIYPVDITRPENLLAQRIPATQYQIAGRALTKSFYAVTAVDRFGNESKPAQEASTITVRPSRDAIIAAVRQHFAGTSAESAPSKKAKKEKASKVKTEKVKVEKVKVEKVKQEKVKAEKQEKKKTEVRTIDFSKYLD